MADLTRRGLFGRVFGGAIGLLAAKILPRVTPRDTWQECSHGWTEPSGFLSIRAFGCIPRGSPVSYRDMHAHLVRVAQPGDHVVGVTLTDLSDGNYGFIQIRGLAVVRRSG